MALAVRVIGRIDIGEMIREVLVNAHLDAQLATGAPMRIFAAAPPADGVDVVVATGSFDPPLWRWMKRRYPSRPMVAVAVGLIGFRGHLTKGVYGVRHGRREEATAAA